MTSSTTIPGSFGGWPTANAEGEHGPKREGPVDPHRGVHGAGAKNPSGAHWKLGFFGPG